MNSTGPVKCPEALVPSSDTVSWATASWLLKCVPQGATITPPGEVCSTQAKGISRTPAVRDWSATYGRLRATAESEKRSLALIHSIMEEHAR